MSNSATKWAWESLIPSGEKFVLLALADNSDSYGKCCPSLKSISEKCCIGRSTAIKHIKTLVDLGLISKEKRSDEQGHRQSNIYFLNFLKKIKDEKSFKVASIDLKSILKGFK